MTQIFMPMMSGAVGPPRRQFGVCIGGEKGYPNWRAKSLALLDPPVTKGWDMGGGEDAGKLLSCIDFSQGNLDNAVRVMGKYPGRIIELGNEPDLGGESYTNSPERFAEVTRWWAGQAGLDFCCPSIIWRDEGQSWLERYLAAGGVVGKYWSIHMYFCVTGDDWRKKWQTWVQWMVARDLVRPTLVTETNAHWVGGDQFDVMDAIADLLDNEPLLHAVYWYSDHDWWDRWQIPDLVDHTADNLTPLGKHYRSLVGG